VLSGGNHHLSATAPAAPRHPARGRWRNAEKRHSRAHLFLFFLLCITAHTGVTQRSPFFSKPHVLQKKKKHFPLSAPVSNCQQKTKIWLIGSDDDIWVSPKKAIFIYWSDALRNWLLSGVRRQFDAWAPPALIEQPASVWDSPSRWEIFSSLKGAAASWFDAAAADAGVANLFAWFSINC